MKKRLYIFSILVLCLMLVKMDFVKAKDVPRNLHFDNCARVGADLTNNMCDNRKVIGWKVSETTTANGFWYCNSGNVVKKTKIDVKEEPLDNQNVQYVGQEEETCGSSGAYVFTSEELIANFIDNNSSKSIYYIEGVFDNSSITVDDSDGSTNNNNNNNNNPDNGNNSTNTPPTKVCTEINDPELCKASHCSWNDSYNFCSVNGLVYLSCGDASDIPEMVPILINVGVTGLKTVTPIVLIIMSIIQLVRSITSGKEDEIKKAQNGLIKRAIAAALVFFVIGIVQFVMLKVADSTEKDGLQKCLSCFLNGASDCDAFYFKNESGEQIKINR